MGNQPTSGQTRDEDDGDPTLSASRHLDDTARQQLIPPRTNDEAEEFISELYGVGLVERPDNYCHISSEERAACERSAGRSSSSVDGCSAADGSVRADAVAPSLPSEEFSITIAGGGKEHPRTTADVAGQDLPHAVWGAISSKVNVAALCAGADAGPDGGVDRSREDRALDNKVAALSVKGPEATCTENASSDNEGDVNSLQEPAVLSSAPPTKIEEISALERRILSLVDGSEDSRIFLTHFVHQYQAKFGESIDYKTLGFLKLKLLLDYMPSLSVSGPEGGHLEYICRKKGTESNFHSDDIPSAPPTLPAPSTGRPFPPHLEHQLAQLVDESSDSSIRLCSLPELYKCKFHRALDYKKYGYRKLQELLNDIPSMQVIGSGGYTSVVRSTSKPAVGFASSAAHDHAAAGDQESSTSSLRLKKPAEVAEELAMKINQGQIILHIKRELAKHPQGCNTDDLMKAVPSFRNVLGDFASKADLPFISPTLVLHHCNGVKKRRSGETNMYFLSDKDDGATRSEHSVDLSPCPTDSVAHDQNSSSNVKNISRTIEGLAKTINQGQIISHLKRELLKHPQGRKTGDIMKAVPSFRYILKEFATKADLPFISPASVLRLCDGVKERKVDGTLTYFLSNEEDGATRAERPVDLVPILGSVVDVTQNIKTKVTNAVTQPPPHAGPEFIASMDFLAYLKHSFHNRPWPTSKKQLKQVLINVEPDSLPRFQFWLNKVLDEELSIGKRRKEAVKHLMFQYQRLGCLSGTANKLMWHISDIDKALSGIQTGKEQSHIAEISTDVNSEASPLECAPYNRGSGINESKDPSSAAPAASYVLIDTLNKLECIQATWPFAPKVTKGASDVNDGEMAFVAVDCEGVPEELLLVQVATPSDTYVFDCVRLAPAAVCLTLEPLLLDVGIIKLFHDLHMDALAFAKIGGVGPLRGCLDAQLVMEHLTGEMTVGFNAMLDHIGSEKHPLKKMMHQRMKNGDIFSKRPLASDVLDYAALDVILLIKAKDHLKSLMGDSFLLLQRASNARAHASTVNNGRRQIAFDAANSCALASRELLEALRPSDMMASTPLVVSDDTSVLLELLPSDLARDLTDSTELLSEIVLDEGRSPVAWVDGSRTFLGNDGRKVEPSDISSIVERLGGFGSDNRAGLEKQLHRISAIRNRESDIIGLTLRVGRHVAGNATMISDLLFGDCSRSILFLGEPGSGKTTVVREVTRLLAERFNVCIVDTSNEIAGDGNVPHPCVGFARRMMVQSLDKQGAVMIECVQNHTPEVMVIDEIGRPPEVEAARTCKQRGVRLIASAHGDLRKLIKNPKLRGLVGGVETVTLGDAQAKEESKKRGEGVGNMQKLKAQRAGPPTFDTIVELRRGAHHEWRIVLDVGDAVDRVLEGQHYKAQRRTRDPDMGSIGLELENA